MRTVQSVGVEARQVKPVREMERMMLSWIAAAENAGMPEYPAPT
jgi:hypothetical protein